MENDVYYTQIKELQRAIQMPSDADLLHQTAIETVNEDWFWKSLVECEAKDLFGRTGLKYSMFNLFRLSCKMLESLQTVYERNHEEWVRRIL